MRFRKFSDDGNVYGWDFIEFQVFNFDGEGSAIALCDGEPFTFASDDVHVIITGGEYKRCYFHIADSEPQWDSELYLVAVSYRSPMLANEKHDLAIRKLIREHQGREVNNDIESGLRTIVAAFVAPAKSKSFEATATKVARGVRASSSNLPVAA